MFTWLEMIRVLAIWEWAGGVSCGFIAGAYAI